MNCVCYKNYRIGVLNLRTCLNCGEKMSAGFLFEELSETYCSNECLDKKYPGMAKVMEDMTDDELEESVVYWTEWEEDDTDDDDEEAVVEFTAEDVAAFKEDFAFFPDFDEDRFNVITFEYAKECFEQDQATYRLLDNGEVFLNRDMDDIIFHEGCDGVFLVERIYCPCCKTNELDMDDLEANAIDRHDNETMICSSCGIFQALQAMKEELGWN